MQVLCSTGAFTHSSDPRSHEAILRYAQEFVIDGLEARAINQEGEVDVARIQTSLQFMRDLITDGEL